MRRTVLIFLFHSFPFLSLSFLLRKQKEHERQGCYPGPDHGCGGELSNPARDAGIGRLGPQTADALHFHPADAVSLCCPRQRMC